MVIVGSVHQLQCLGVLEVAVGQQGDSVSVYLSVCMCVCKHRVDLLWSVLSGWMAVEEELLYFDSSFFL